MSDGRRSPQPDKLATVPLPPGWEAKYDFGQKRYFFIDHRNKKTTWDDPRIKILERQQQQQQPARSTGEDLKTSRVSPKPSPTHGKPGGTPSKSTTSSHHHHHGWQSQVEEKYGMKVELIKDDVEGESEVTKHVMARFPTVSKDLMNIVLASYSSEEDICRKLREMGYKEQEQKPTVSSQSALEVPGSKSSSSNNRLDNTGRASPDRSASPKLILPKFSDPTKKSSSPGHHTKNKGSGHKSHQSSKPSPLAELSADKKKRMMEKLEQEFKGHDKIIIESVLVSCSYDEEKARCQLQLITTSKCTTGATDSTTDVSAGGNQSKTSVASSAENGTLPSEASEHESLKAETDVDYETRQRDDLGYVSGLRQTTKGHDPSLAKGPNKSLLLSDYISDVGSQSAYYHGPSKENYRGPSAELRKGHEPGLAKGPVTANGASP